MSLFRHLSDNGVANWLQISGWFSDITWAVDSNWVASNETLWSL